MSFLKQAVVGSAAIVVPAVGQQGQTQSTQTKTQTAIPRWRGFNVLEMFTMRSSGDFVAEDFQWMRDWGFNFVRFPACYRLWIEGGDDYKIKESMLAKLDRGIELANQAGLHVSLNFHRGPGYSVNAEFKEPHSLWKDKERPGRLLLPVAVDGQAVQGHLEGQAQLRSDQ